MLGIIGGTSFLGTEVLEKGENLKVHTVYGDIDVVETSEIVFIARHGLHGYLPPHRINHQAHIEALYQTGVNKIVSFGSTGSLSKDIKPGSLMIPDDFFAPFRVMTFQQDVLRYVVPGYDDDWRSKIVSQLKKEELEIIDGGVYAEALGPRFETPSEIRFLSQYADVVGMTCAAEATLANEIGIPLATICIVDNYANGVGAEQLTGELFQEQVKQNKEKVNRALNIVFNLKDFEVNK